MRQIKGVLLFIAFISIAIGLVVQPEAGVMHWMGIRDISPVWWAWAFAISGAANLYIGLLDRRWNALWFAVFFAYTTMVWVAIGQGCRIPVAQGVSNTLLSTFLALELLEGAGKWKTSQ